MVEIFVFEPDLIFSSKFEGVSRLTHVDFRIFTILEEFLEAVHGDRPQALIVNLDSIQSEILSTLTRNGYPLLGYYSHVNSDIAKTATDMGVGIVVARGAFVSNVEALIRRLLSIAN